MTVPTGAGLGVEVDLTRVEELHQRYVSSGRTQRDDATYMRTVDPGFDPAVPRW